MKKIFTLLSACLLSVFVYGQTISSSVVASAGESVETSNLNISWTLGELAIETLTSSSVILTQGFQQGYFEVTAIDDPTSNNFQLKVYPNPAIDFVWVSLESDEIHSAKIELFDMEGKLVYIQKWESIDGPTKIELNELSSSQYILRVTDLSGKPLQNFKLIKR